MMLTYQLAVYWGVWGGGGTWGACYVLPIREPKIHLNQSFSTAVTESLRDLDEAILINLDESTAQKNTEKTSLFEKKRLSSLFIQSIKAMWKDSLK